jgi:hypothetical protein
MSTLRTPEAQGSFVVLLLKVYLTISRYMYMPQLSNFSQKRALKKPLNKCTGQQGLACNSYDLGRSHLFHLQRAIAPYSV